MKALLNPPGTAGVPGANALMPYSVSMPMTRAFRRAGGSAFAVANSPRSPVEAMASA